MKRSQCYPGLTPSNSDGVVWRERRRGGTEVRRRSGGTCAMENVWEVGRGRNVTGGSLDLVRDMTVPPSLGRDPLRPIGARSALE